MDNTQAEKLRCPICGSTYVINHALEDVLKAGNIIYYRSHKHRNWKHEKYEVIVGDLIVNRVDTENSARILEDALRNAFVALTAVRLEVAQLNARLNFVEQLLGNAEYPLSKEYFVYGEWLGKSLLDTLHAEKKFLQDRLLTLGTKEKNDGQNS